MDWQTHTAEHKQALLRHCCWMAELDPDYAIWAAQDYESRNPALLLKYSERPTLDPYSVSGHVTLALFDELLATAAMVGDR